MPASVVIRIKPPGSGREELKIIGNTDERHGPAAKPSVIHFNEHVPGNHQPAQCSKLQTQRRVVYIDVRGLLADVWMGRPRRVHHAIDGGRICGAAALSVICVRLSHELGTTKQTLSINIKCTGQTFRHANISSHNVDEPVGKPTLGNWSCARWTG